MNRIRWPLAWRFSWRYIGGLIRASGCALMLAAVYAVALPFRAESTLYMRAVEIVVPLVFSMQAALAFAPSDEFALESMLACPRPAYWIAGERLLVTGAAFGGIGLAATGLSMLVPGSEPFWLAAVRWLVPALFIGSFATLLSVVAGHTSYGLLLSIVMCGFALVGGDAILSLYPWLWIGHPFLQPGDVEPHLYAINRLFLAALGAGLFARALMLTTNEEKMLGLS